MLSHKSNVNLQTKRIVLRRFSPYDTKIGYCSGFDYWGNGYMTEAVSAVVKFLFEEVSKANI